MISLLSLPMEVPGMVLNRYCGSGLEAVALAAARVHAGTADCVIAGGAESMTMVPTMGWRPILNYGIAANNPDYYLGMGLTAEELAKDYSITREEQDEFSYNSHMKALAAIKAGKFKDEIVPITVKENYYDPKTETKKSREFVVDTDEGPRLGTSMAALGKLRAVFAQG